MIFRAITGSVGRFIALFLISALGVGFLAGLLSATPNMATTGSAYFDDGSLAHLRLLSNIGLDDSDVEALEGIEGIETVVPFKTADILFENQDGITRALKAYAIDLDDPLSCEINRLTLSAGRLPENPNECLAESTISAIKDVHIGDTLTFSVQNDEDTADSFLGRQLTVVGLVDNPYYMSMAREQTTVGSGAIDEVIYVDRNFFDTDYYTELMATISGAGGLISLSDSYDLVVDPVLDAVEDLAETQKHHRHDKVLGEAREKIDDAWETFYEEEAKAEEEFAKAEDKIAQAEIDIADGKQTLAEKEAEARQEIADGEQELADAFIELTDGEQELADGIADYEQGLIDLEEGKLEYADGLAKWEDGLLEYQDGLAEYEDGLAQLKEGQQDLRDAENTIAESEAQLNAGQAQLDASVAGSGYSSAQDFIQDMQASGMGAYIPGFDQLVAGQQQITAGRAELESGKQQLSNGWASLEEGGEALKKAKRQLLNAWLTLEEGRKELEDAAQELADGEQELIDAKADIEQARIDLDEGWEEYYDGLRELEDGKIELETEIAKAKADIAQGERDLEDGKIELADARLEAEEALNDAEMKILDAENKLKDIEEPKWYILGRDEMLTPAGFEANTEKVASIARVFPVFFFMIAALVCLTTMTRMVEEERGLIGTMKALGYGSGAIASKYLVYAFVASVSGAAVGLSIGFTVLPRIIWDAYAIMYRLPPLQTAFHWNYALIATGGVLACTMGATAWVCRESLRESAASLMLPKAPEAGKRVLLEHIPFIWNRLSFNHKVTVRNLFRYKKRFFMTVFGVAGCTALLVTGFGLRDSIGDILNNQFNKLWLFDLTIGIKETDETPLDPNIQKLMAETGDHMTVRMEGGKVRVEDGPVSELTIFVPSDADRFTEFVDFHTRVGKNPIEFDSHKAILTEKASRTIGAEAGDTITVINADDEEVLVEIVGITENYIRGYLYMGPDLYAELFGAQPVDNNLICKSGGLEEADRNVLAEKILHCPSATAVTFTQDTARDFSDTFKSIDMIVVMLIICAGLLAFVVLYNLTNINICERQKEIATLKVLGFFENEVSAYVLRESTVLTLFGALTGLVLGKMLHAFVVVQAEVDMVMFGRVIVGKSYFFSVLMTFFFSLCVSLFMNGKLKSISMVESMKAPE
ncbi:MAG: hypothetical protein IKU27_02475 [Clostridia bacterium]|nr:hypothetical protein [Clostridia bacterium]